MNEGVALLLLALGLAASGCARARHGPECDPVVQRLNASTEATLAVERAAASARGPELAAPLRRLADAYDAAATLDATGASATLVEAARAHDEASHAAAESARRMALAVETQSRTSEDAARRDYDDAARRERTAIASINGYCGR